MAGVIERDLTPRLRAAARKFPVVTVTGPRQSGKSTLCRAVFPKHSYTSLEAPDVRSFAQEDPKAFLAQFPKGAVLDEVQRCPLLPSYLQGIVDDDPRPGKWILTGSQNLALIASVSQSLAGRTALLHLLPLARSEVLRFDRRPGTLEETVLAGGYPRIFDRKLAPSEWLSSYASTYVERDVRSVANIGDLGTFQRFLGLCAGRTGQLLNLSSLAGDCGISQPTAKAWLSVLEATFIAFRLPSYSGNLRKRLVKMPKLHFYDTGLVSWLLGIRDAGQLRTHPLCGAIFETWVVSEIVKQRENRGESGGVFFYRDQHGVEADLVVERGGKLLLVEAKAGTTASGDFLDPLRRVGAVLGAAKRPQSFAVYGGEARQSRSEGAILPWSALHEEDWAPGRKPRR